MSLPTFAAAKEARQSSPCFNQLGRTNPDWAFLWGTFLRLSGPRRSAYACGADDVIARQFLGLVAHWWGNSHSVVVCKDLRLEKHGRPEFHVVNTRDATERPLVTVAAYFWSQLLSWHASVLEHSALPEFDSRSQH